MKTITLELELSNNEKPTIVVISNGKVIKFISEVPLRFKKSEAPSNSYDFISDSEVKNPIGYSIDRIRRMVEFNPNIKAIILDGERIDLIDDYIEPSKLEDIHFVNGYPFESGQKVVVSIISSDGVPIHKHEGNYDDVVSGKMPPLNYRCISVPAKKDENGNPRYTRNVAINELLFKSRINHGDDIRQFTECLNNNKMQILLLAKLAKSKGIDSITGDMLLELSRLNKRRDKWQACKVALSTRKKEFKNVGFKVEDLLNLLN